MSKYPPHDDELASILNSIQQEIESSLTHTGPHVTWPSYPSPTPTHTLPRTTSSTPLPTYTSANHTETNPANPNIQNSKDFWDKLTAGTKAGIIVAAVVAILIVSIASIWFCCGCCGLRHRNQRRKEILHPTPDTDTVPLQERPVTTQNRQVPVVNRHLTPMSRMASTISRASRGEAPPPLYTEVTPPQHTTIAGGITHVREEEEGIISDGKMPLSEIPFEDVILDHSSSGSSARNFGGRHMGLGGDTTGHTNS